MPRPDNARRSATEKTSAADRGSKAGRGSRASAASAPTNFTWRTGLAILLAVLTILAYVPVYRADFVDFDDYPYVTRNPNVKSGLSGTNIVWAWTHSHSANWHPLTWMSHMLDVGLFGLDAPGHHAMNVALHVVNAVLLFWMLSSLTGQIAPSFVVAGLFAIHPVNVESVAWIAQRKTTLSTLFAILSIWSYAMYARAKDASQPCRWPYALSLAFFTSSLLAKQMMVTMPFALLLLDYWPLERKALTPADGSLPTLRSLARGWLQLLPDKLPYLLITIAASVVTVIAQKTALETAEVYPLEMRLGNVVISYANYLGLLVWPAHLAVFYPLALEDITIPRLLVSLAVILVLSAVCFVVGRKRRYVLTGWFWYLGTLVPVIGLVHVGRQSMADRYAYIPFWGLSIALVWLIYQAVAPRLSSQAVRAAAVGVVVALFATLSALTFLQAGKWHDTITLFEDALADTDRNWLAHRSLAEQYMDRGEYDLSLWHAEKASEYDKSMGRNLSHVGLKMYEEGNKDVGLRLMQLAVRAMPDDAAGFTDLGWAYADNGRHVLAVEQFAIAAEKMTEENTPYARRTNFANWGNSLAKLNRFPEALEKYDRALEIEPDTAFLWRDAAEIDLQVHQVDSAVTRLQKALTLDPKDAKATFLLGQAMAAQEKWTEAVAAFERTAELAPNSADVTLQLAQALARVGREAEAKTQLETLLAAVAKTRDPSARLVASNIHAQLGDLARERKETAEAVRQYERALVDKSDNPIAANNLAWLLATDPDEKLRDPARALELAQQAGKLRGPNDHATLTTLAAAHAANGNRNEAITTAHEALRLAKENGATSAAVAIERQLESYEKGQPFIDR